VEIKKQVNSTRLVEIKKQVNSTKHGGEMMAHKDLVRE
jgi:hypothetical protein